MKKIIIVFAAMFCINSLVWWQQKLKYLKNDNTFYLESKRLSENEIRQTLFPKIFQFLILGEKGIN